MQLVDIRVVVLVERSDRDEVDVEEFDELQRTKMGETKRKGRDNELAGR